MTIFFTCKPVNQFNFFLTVFKHTEIPKQPKTWKFQVCQANFNLHKYYFQQQTNMRAASAVRKMRVSLNLFAEYLIVTHNVSMKS